ncbi:hypothetical protein HFD91_21130 [Enterobacteriaceae bacterium EKM102V]|uniref:hypothetical protein n=1 Tax=Pantoea TaxID=53335 RepID=UPI00142D859A|nr:MULTISPECIES: hypothetical protein [Pantoea]KAF6653087.1 hypothetical protein HFD91_21130 [Enterobacteriaceae bacterium EKM102V]KAF6663500.1 hypothetical protein HFD97_21040 [Pantoea sp. EKM103V]
MLTLSPVWHGRLRATNRAGNFLLQTLVIHPALLFFLLFLLSAHGSGGAGQWLLNEAEALVRDAPAGQLWGCVSQAMPVETWPPVSDTSRDKAVPVSSDIRPAPPTAMCVKAAVSRDAWASQTNDTLLFLYKAGVVLSVLSGLVVRHFRRRVNGENV